MPKNKWLKPRQKLENALNGSVSCFPRSNHSRAFTIDSITHNTKLNFENNQSTLRPHNSSLFNSPVYESSISSLYSSLNILFAPIIYSCRKSLCFYRLLPFIPKINGATVGSIFWHVNPYTTW